MSDLNDLRERLLDQALEDGGLVDIDEARSLIAKFERAVRDQVVAEILEHRMSVARMHSDDFLDGLATAERIAWGWKP